MSIRSLVIKLLLLLLYLPAFMVSAVSIKPYYVELGMGINEGIAGGESSTQQVFQRAHASGTILLNKNQAPSYGMSFMLGGGYQHLLTGPWSWSVGGQLTQLRASVEGTANYLDPSYGYTYNTDILAVSALGRIYYQESLKWRYYTGLSLGLTQLKSGHYSATYKSETADDNSAHSERALSYGLQAGLGYLIAPKVELSTGLSYQAAGASKLGAKQGNWVKSPEGHIQQVHQYLSLAIMLSYHF